MPEKFEFYAIKLSVIAVIVFGLSAVFSDFFYANFMLVSSEVLAKPWTIITHIFMHGDLFHLGSNLFALLLFGTILEKYIGSRKFLFVFFSAGIVSSVGDIMFYNATLGASGAVFGIIGTLAVIRPKLIVWAFGAPMYMIIAAILWAALDFAGVFYPDNIAHVAHLLGMGFGIIAGLELRLRYRKRFKEKKKPLEKVSSKDEKPTEEELDKWEEEWMKQY